jgi:hypothetical protein
MRNSRRSIDRIRSTASGAEETPRCNSRIWSPGVVNYTFHPMEEMPLFIEPRNSMRHNHSICSDGNATGSYQNAVIAVKPLHLVCRKLHDTRKNGIII